MIIDTSAIVAILREEAEARRFAEVIEAAPVRRISAVTLPSSISIRAQVAVGSPSKTYPALPSLTSVRQPISRTSGTWVWPHTMTDASVLPTRSMVTT